MGIVVHLYPGAPGEMPVTLSVPADPLLDRFERSRLEPAEGVLEIELAVLCFHREERNGIG